jgi:hypothetical protein
MRKIKHLISETNNAILAVGALAAAALAMFGVAKAVMSLNEGSPTPAGLLAGVEDVTLIPNIGLAEYEAREQTAQVGGAARPVALPARYRLAAYTAATGATSHSGTNDSEPETTSTSTSTSTPEPNPQSTPEPTPTTTTPEPKHKPRKERRPHEKSGSTGTHKSPHHHAGPKQGASAVHESLPEGSSGPSGVPFVKPPPPEMSFKSEGHAQTLAGTGASTSEVEGVLAEASGSTPATGSSPSEGGEQTHGSTQTTPTTGASPSKEATTPTSATPPKIALTTHCKASCPLAPTVDQIIADSSNPAENARKLVTVFTHSRGRYIDHELHPLGADVEYTLKLTGFVGNDAILEWTLWSQSTGEPLPNSWWQRVIVKQVKPSRYEETISGTFWAPIPPKRGDYVFHLVVYDEHGSRRGHGETPIFH